MRSDDKEIISMILKTVSECPHCEACRQLAHTYLKLMDPDGESAEQPRDTTRD